MWPDQTSLSGLGVTDDALAIGTDVTVAVSVHALAQQPNDDSDDFDLVVEASLSLVPGRLVVLDCTEPPSPLRHAARFDMPTRWTRIRVSRRNLAAAAFPGPDTRTNRRTPR